MIKWNMSSNIAQSSDLFRVRIYNNSVVDYVILEYAKWKYEPYMVISGQSFLKEF